MEIIIKRKIHPILKKVERCGYGCELKKCIKILKGNKSCSLFTPNAEMLSAASKNEELHRLLSSADILFPDGIGINCAMKTFGLRPLCRSCGIELAERLFSQLSDSDNSTRIFLLGGERGVSQAAAKKLALKYEGLYICGTHHGYFDINGKENSLVIDNINKSGAQLLIVGMGFPRQEMWIRDNLSKLPNVRLAMGLGGSLDVWSGNVQRAPVAFQKMGFEWLYRAISSPKRISRLPSLFEFLIAITKEKASFTKHKCIVNLKNQ